MMSRGKRIAGVGVATVALVTAVGGAAHAAAPAALQGWQQTAAGTVLTATGGEGVSTLDNGTVRYVGLASIPLAQRLEGWTHIGDTDASHGYIFDSYQAENGGSPKMFLATTPSGASYEYTHTLASGEAYNNSFATVSPDGQWLVSGEWNTMTRLLVFPTPILNTSTPATGGALNLASQISLDHQVRNVQGCDFLTPTRLLCASDDPNTDLWPTSKPLLQVDLPAPLNGQPVTGHVTSLGQLPLKSSCTGTFETEGIDYHAADATLRVEVIDPQPCGTLTTAVYSFRPTS